MNEEELKVLLGAFDDSGNCLIYFDLIEGVQNMSNKELDAQIKDAFEIYMVHSHIPNAKDVICKFMFIYPKDEGKSYTTWGMDAKVMPYSNRLMSSIYKYSMSGEIIEVYE